MSSIISSDWHFNENPKEKYRWGLLPWLGEQVKKYKVDNLICCGDTTDAKDRHGSVLVNRFVDQLMKIDCRRYILKGNHDFYDPQWPFFGFTDYMPGIEFIERPETEYVAIAGKKVQTLWLPATKDWEADWSKALDQDLDRFDYIFCHATFDGVLAENGMRLSGIPPSIFRETRAKIWSGDIHTPQRCGPVEYVGAPYRTRFGDIYNPRCVLIDDRGEAHDLHFPCPSKHVITIRTMRDLEKATRDFESGDHVKVKVRLLRSEHPEWPRLRQDITEVMERKELLLFGPTLEALEVPKKEAEKSGGAARIEPRQLIKDYGKNQRVPKEGIEIGVKLIDEL